MKENDVRDLAESYGRRIAANGCFIFGVRRTRYLIGLIHWVQDFVRIGKVPTLAEFGADEPHFVWPWRRRPIVMTFGKLKRNSRTPSARRLTAASSRRRKSGPEWEPAFVNYRSTIPGVNGIPLSYVVRENQTPIGADYGSLNKCAIACAPLTGDVFQADARKVHQLIKRFLQAECAEQWIKPHAERQSGRQDMDALLKHYSGKGNTS